MTNRQYLNVWLLSAAIICTCLQVLLVMGLVASWLPTTYPAGVTDLYLRTRTSLTQEYDLPIFRAFILIGVGLTVAAGIVFRRRLSGVSFTRPLARFVAMGTLWGVLGLIAVFEIVTRKSPGWAWALLYTAIGGNALTWFLWPWQGELWATWKKYLRPVAGAVRSLDTLIREEVKAHLNLRIAFALFCTALVLTLVLNKNCWPMEQVPSLPFFLPLRYRAEALYAFSFLVPLVYMAAVLHTVPGVARPNAPARGPLMFGLGVYGALLFYTYARYPVPDNFPVVAWPALLIALLWLTDRQLWRISSTVVVSLLAGVQAALMCVWLEEQFKFPIMPSHFSMIVYTAFLAGAMLTYMGLIIFNARRLASFAVLQVCVCLLMSMALFKLIYFDYRSQLARGWFKGLGWVVLLQPLLWFAGARAAKLLKWCWGKMDPAHASWVCQGFILLAVFGAVYVPDVEALTAHIFMGEYMHHTDTFIMGPAWAYANGRTLDVDVYSRYGLGTIPFLVGFMKLLGGISYTHLFTAVVWVCTLYFMGVYLFYQRWLGSRLLALTAWMMAFKVDNSFELAFPFVYTYPQSTMARMWPDIIWMWSMLMFMETARKRWLAVGSVCVGFTFWYMPSIGLYMIPAHLVMAIMMVWRHFPGKWRWGHAVWPMVLAGGTAFVLLFALCGQWVFNSVFWHNATDFFDVFMFMMSAPLLQSLENKQFLDVLVFCLIVLVYLGTIVKVGLDFLRGAEADRRDWLALGLSIYGLGLLEHYVVFSNGNNYYSKTVPFFIVLFHWIAKALAVAGDSRRRYITWAGAGLALVALVTNHSVMSYPNLWNVSKQPLLDARVARPLPDGRPYFHHKDRYTVQPDLQFDVNSLGTTDEGLYTEYDFKNNRELIERYHKDADFSQDAALISGLTRPEEPVALLSSHEVRLLMQARREPFFYYFPLLATRAMGVRSWPSEMMDRERDFELTLDSLKRARPQYIFMEKIMNSDHVPPAYERVTPGLWGLVHYVKANYVPDKEGHFLIAMKRKD